MNNIKKDKRYRLHCNRFELYKEDFKKEGIEQGIEQGLEQRNDEIIQNMLKNNVSIDNIMLYTGTSRNKINEIRQMTFN